MAKTSTQQPAVGVLTIDVVALLDRLNALELRVKNLRETTDSNYQAIIEHVPRIVDGKVMCKVFTDDDMVDLELKSLSPQEAAKTA